LVWSISLINYYNTNAMNEEHVVLNLSSETRSQDLTYGIEARCTFTILGLSSTILKTGKGGSPFLLAEIVREDRLVQVDIVLKLCIKGLL